MPEAEAIVPVFAALHASFSRPEPASQFRARACLLQLLAAWTEALTTHGGVPNRVQAYRTLIEKNAMNPQSSLSVLAARIGLTPDRLVILFQREFGMTPVEYRTRLRLVRAAQRLSGSLDPVSDIARECGFADPNYFARAFRRKFGQSPREFMSRNRQRMSVVGR